MNHAASKNVNVIKIEKVTNHAQRALFEMKVEEFKWENKPTNKELMFHGTTVAPLIAKSINGVDIYWGKDADKGFGAYFAYNFSYSYNYSTAAPTD